MRKSLFKPNFTLFLYHALAWLVYYFLGINWLKTSEILPLRVIALTFIYMATFYSALIGFVLFFAKRKWMKWLLYQAIIYLLFLVLVYFYAYETLPHLGILFYNDDFSFSMKLYIQAAFPVLFRFTLYAFAYFLFGKERKAAEEKIAAIERKEKIKRLEIDNKLIRAEKDRLKLELHPHTINNMVNSLYARALNRSPELAHDVFLLGRFISQNLGSLLGKEDLVVIAKEVRSIRNFLHLSTGAVEEGLLNFTIQGMKGSQLIPPMLLLSIVENMLKYGVLHDAKYPATIDLILKPNYLEFNTHNKIAVDKLCHVSHGIGFENIIRRMDIFYPNQYQFRAEQINQFFYVNLLINYT